jgi:N-acetylglucosaminyldiphosphoundecaprenol N-acetyl-beta-D-mannosaminyltransferase
VLDHIASATPHVLFVGLGAPKQEFFIRNHIRPLNIPLAVGIGGSFEILSGKLNRAPMWMQSSGLEWAYSVCVRTRLPGLIYLLIAYSEVSLVFCVGR